MGGNDFALHRARSGHESANATMATPDATMAGRNALKPAPERDARHGPGIAR